MISPARRVRFTLIESMSTRARLLCFTLALLSSSQLGATTIVTWIEDTSYGFSVSISGVIGDLTPTLPSGMFGPAYRFTPSSPSGLWQIDLSGWDASLINSDLANGVQFHSFAVSGTYNGDDAFTFSSAGGWGGLITALPYGGANSIHSQLILTPGEPDPNWYGLTRTTFTSATDVDDMSTWSFTHEIYLNAPAWQRVPDSGGSAVLLGISMMLSFLFRRTRAPHSAIRQSR